jgi:sec-independent protein translocase protein TatB
VARTAGHLLGRLQRYVGDVKADINREMQLDELKKMQQQVSTQVSSLESSVTHEMREIEDSVDPGHRRLPRKTPWASADFRSTPATGCADDREPSPALRQAIEAKT